jgi:hypothetical protein
MHKLDYEKNADYIISKVFDNGSLQDILEIMAWYGDNKSKESLNERALPKEITMVFASKLFHIPISSLNAPLRNSITLSLKCIKKNPIAA